MMRVVTLSKVGGFSNFPDFLTVSFPRLTDNDKKAQLSHGMFFFVKGVHL